MSTPDAFKVTSPVNRLHGEMPRIGIRPTIDGRRRGVRESLEVQTMNMAKAAAELISSNLRYPNGMPVECVIADQTIGGAAEAAMCAEKFKNSNVMVTLTVTPCWCYGSETMDMDPLTQKAVWGFNGTERPGAVYLAAVLAACVAKGLAWEESVRVANTAAGVVVGKMGTAPVTLAELRAALRENAENPKLYALPDLLEKVEDWRRKSETVVFTNGCFDLLHPGHVSLLRQSAAQGDHLIVGLNSDASVRRLKGPSRPIQDERSRAQLLAALYGVEAVVLFDADTPLELITAIRPDVLVKGSDYTEAAVVGADVVRAAGGRVFLAALTPGCSTTGNDTYSDHYLEGVFACLRSKKLGKPFE